MPSQTIPRATIADVEAALSEQYGAVFIRPLAQSQNSKAWMFRAGGRQTGKCSASEASEGTTVFVSSYTPLWLKICTVLFIIIGLVAFIFPGLILIAFTIIRYVIVSAALKMRFPKLIETVSKHTQARLAKK